MNKFTIKDIEKGLDYMKKNCNAIYVRIEFDERDRLLIKGSDLSGNSVTVIIYDESTAKMPDVTKTERL